MSAQGHQPGGQPAGGQFMTTSHSESPVALGGQPPFLSLGDMSGLDPIEQGMIRTRMGQLRDAGLTGHATDFEAVDGWGVSFRLKNNDGEFVMSLNDDQFAVISGKNNPIDPGHEYAADLNVVARGLTMVTPDQIRATYNPAMTRARTARRFAERSGLRSGGNVKFGLPELRNDEWGRPVGSMDITMDVKTGGAITYTVLLPRGKDKIEAYNHQGKLLTPRMTAALLEEATEEGGGPAGTDMISNAIAVTLLEEGETW